MITLIVQLDNQTRVFINSLYFIRFRDGTARGWEEGLPLV